MRRIVSPYFRSHLLVSEANVSDVLFLGFYSDQRFLFLGVKRFLNARSRAGTLNRISSGQSLRNDCYCFRVILTKLLVRICSLKQLYVGVKIPHCSLGSIMDPFFEKRRISYCVVRRWSTSFTLPLPSYESHALQLESI